jgi:hypothetical protein
LVDTDISGHSSTTKDGIVYPCIPSATRPVPHSDSIPIPVPPLPEAERSLDDYRNSSASSIQSSESEYEPTDQPHLLKQQDLNDLVRDLALSKEHAELLGSRLQQWNLLDAGTRVSVFRTRHEELSTFLIWQMVFASARTSMAYSKN